MGPKLFYYQEVRRSSIGCHPVVCSPVVAIHRCSAFGCGFRPSRLPITSAASFCIVGRTCEYASSARVIEPSCSLTTLAGVSARSNCVSQVGRRSYRRTSGNPALLRTGMRDVRCRFEMRRQQSAVSRLRLRGDLLRLPTQFLVEAVQPVGTPGRPGQGAAGGLAVGIAPKAIKNFSTPLLSTSSGDSGRR